MSSTRTGRRVRQASVQGPSWDWPLAPFQLHAALVGGGDEHQSIGVADRHTSAVDVEDVHDGLGQLVQHLTDVVVVQERPPEAGHSLGEAMVARVQP